MRSGVAAPTSIPSRRTRRTIVVAVPVLLVALAPFAACGAQRAELSHSGSVGNGELTLTDAWIRPTPPIANVGAFYLTITNEGSEDARVVAASSPRCAEIEIHQTTIVDGVASMSAAAPGELELAPGDDLVFEPTGLHVMCLGLDEPIEEGQSVPLTVDFDRTGSLTIEAEADNR